MKAYFTFGSDPKFPYGRNDYVEVIAKDMHEAVALFEAVHPGRNGFVNCAFYYTEEAFNEFRDKYYKGIEPIEVISVTVNGGK